MVWLIPWCPLPLWNSTMISDVNFLGTTMVSCIVYLSLTTFLSILLSSSIKFWSCLVLMDITLLIQNLSFCCSSHRTSELSFPMLLAGWVGYQFNGMDFLHDVFNHIIFCCHYVVIAIVMVQTQSPELGDGVGYYIPFAWDVFELDVKLL